ncbi:DUF4347 domain-containing protein, partial [Microcoleus sp. BROC3]|uniref:DUF4347 domain-containing protein n=1 Tax=Microcoleus sp. BROC3 TaxID=3055323 RepID=UPI002FD6DF5F
MSNQIIFVDSSVQDYQSLINNADATQIVILDDTSSGIDQITNVLANQKDISAVQLLSHGSEGSLKLGADVLNENNLEKFNTQIKQWGKALTEKGDILLYGCDVAATETGNKLIESLSQLTGADVAASNDLTGNKALGGDWDLEIVTGKIEAAVPFDREAMKDYEYTLASFSVTVATDDGTGTVAGTLSKAILDANAAAGDDTITLTTNVTVTGVMKTLVNSNIDFIGNNFSVSGGNAFRPFFVKSGTVNFSNMTVTNGRAKGGNAGNRGAGGAGMGGGLFIYGGTVGVNNVTFSNNSAVGGNGNGGGGRGGGGMFGNSVVGLRSGGGGLFGSSTSTTGGYGGNGNYGGSAGSPSSAGGFGGGGGGGGDYDPQGGAGGFGGGGGAGDNGYAPQGGAGGFGGGGGGGYNRGQGGAGGFGGGGGGGGGIGAGGAGGTFAGNGISNGGFGGGGAGLGGAIFVRSGSLTLNNTIFTSNAATGGTSTNNGQGKGGAIFAMTSSPNTNGNTLGMPTTPPTVTTFGATFTSNTAANQAGTPTATTPANGVGNSQDNNDVYGTIGNTAPVLADTVVTLSAILEDAVAPTGAVGTLISSIAAIGTGQNNITDPDTGAVAGIAITAADIANGSWFYTIDGGTTWTALGLVFNTNARLLAANANTRIYFQPTADYNGTVTNGITFRAWDNTSGTNGGTADTSTNGSFYAFSVATDTAAITVNPVNDKPSFTNLGNQTLTSWTNTTQIVPSWVKSVTFGPTTDEVTTQAVKNYTVNITSGNTLFTTGPTVANDGTLTYTPKGQPGTATVEVQLQDNGGTLNGGVDLSEKATFNITFPAPKVNLTASTTTASEAGKTAITFTATAEGNVVGAQTVNLALTGTASAADFTAAIPTQITIPDGSNTGQVTITVNDDLIAEGAETATLTISNPSTGIALGTTTNQSVTITDNDTAGITITPTTGLITTEAGGKATFSIQLKSQPTADVTVGLTSDNIAEGTVSPTSVTFTAANWNTPQTVTATGVDENLVDGNKTYNIVTAAATSTDPNYNGFNPTDVAVTNTDNDVTLIPEIQVLDGTTDIVDGTTSTIDFGSVIVGTNLNKT